MQNQSKFRARRYLCNCFYLITNSINSMELNSISVLTVLTIVFGVTTACFITNCPPGGKRSFLSNNIEVQHKQVQNNL